MGGRKQKKGNQSKETMNLILTDPQLLDCYICYQPLSPPIFQCKNGHISCSSCCTKSHNKCASCRLEIGNMRCRPIEQMLESIKVNCRNSKYGCKRKVLWNKMNVHESSCVYEPFSCPHSACSFVGSSGQLSSHLIQKHKNSVINFSYYSKFTMCYDTRKDYYILREERDECLFLLSYSSFSPSHNVATVSRIGRSLRRMKFYYEINVEVEERVYRSQSTARVIQNRVHVPPPPKGSLLIPNDLSESSSIKSLEVCIWPKHTIQRKRPNLIPSREYCCIIFAYLWCLLWLFFCYI